MLTVGGDHWSMNIIKWLFSRAAYVRELENRLQQHKSELAQAEKVLAQKNRRLLAAELQLREVRSKLHKILEGLQRT